MGEKHERGSRVLRFAVSSALLVAPLGTGCGAEEVTANEPYQEPVHQTINEPVEPSPNVEVPPPEPEPTPNEPNAGAERAEE